MALVLLIVAVSAPAPGARRDHMADLAQILLATTIFWAYVEFIQFLIIWEEDITEEIAWYLRRLHNVWQPAMFVAVALGFFVPFFLLLTRPGKRSRVVVAGACLLILFGHLAGRWWLVLPEFADGHPFWLDVAALLTLGSVTVLLLLGGLHYRGRLVGSGAPAWKADHG
jgi:hypothetical protein